MNKIRNTTANTDTSRVRCWVELGSSSKKFECPFTKQTLFFVENSRRFCEIVEGLRNLQKTQTLQSIDR